MNPNDISFLVAQLRDLDEDARKFLVWASFFGSTYVFQRWLISYTEGLTICSFKVTEVAFMMDWDDSSGSSSDDDADVMNNVTKAVSHLGETTLNTTRGAMRGLQLAIQEGWLIQRARDMCSFAHDRYRQAAQAEAANLPEGAIPKMSFRVCHPRFICRTFLIPGQIILMMLHEPTPDIYRIAEFAKQYVALPYSVERTTSEFFSRCLPLLREHHRRDVLLDLSIDAGDSARARGAHEASLYPFSVGSMLIFCDSWRSNLT